MACVPAQAHKPDGTVQILHGAGFRLRLFVRWRAVCELKRHNAVSIQPTTDITALMFVRQSRESATRHHDHCGTQVGLSFFGHTYEQPWVRHVKTPGQPVRTRHRLFCRITLHHRFRHAFRPENNLRRGSQRSGVRKTDQAQNTEHDGCRFHVFVFIRSSSWHPSGSKKRSAVRSSDGST